MIETTPGGSIIITGPDIRSYQLLAIRSALKLEMKWSELFGAGVQNRALYAAQEVLKKAGLPAGRTRKTVLVQYEKHLKAIGLGGTQ